MEEQCESGGFPLALTNQCLRDPAGAEEAFLQRILGSAHLMQQLFVFGQVTDELKNQGGVFGPGGSNREGVLIVHTLEEYRNRAK